ncbi:sulfite exporter TauE/SafE family protein [Nocardioides yefusunii]|uniref:Probable membrane transporter protein n=1 Tax=Nocardioides yefusunii TaxID=2500546 RepID=A0ABW1QZQ6_9ACTN|nr:sulfite exporter TauE/SafE family protein [Nocardioides yefusunii]
MTTVLAAVLFGALIGLSLGMLGAGGSILAIPVLTHVLGQSGTEAATGALVVVGVSSLMGVLTSLRHRTVMVARGLTFGAVALGGTTIGALASEHVSEDVLMLCFGVVMLLVGISMAVRARRPGAGAGESGFDTPVIGFRPTFHLEWPRALQIVLTATLVGFLTGFLGVGGGFLVVPALVMALGLPMRNAAATSMLVIVVTSSAALMIRSGTGVHPDWDVVAALTGATAVATVVGTRLSGRVNRALLHRAFTVLVLTIAVFVLGESVLAHL